MGAKKMLLLRLLLQRLPAIPPTQSLRRRCHRQPQMYPSLVSVWVHNKHSYTINPSLNSYRYALSLGCPKQRGGSKADINSTVRFIVLKDGSNT